MKKILLVGLDLSFNSTGICMTTIEDDQPKIMTFHRVVYDAETNKTGKIYNPHDMINVNQVVYRMPTNIMVEDMLLVDSDKNNMEQLHTTLRAMICSKKINSIVLNQIADFKPDTIICTIENYIMPAFGGPNSLKSVSGLILLQGYVREFFVRLFIKKKNQEENNVEPKVYMYTPTPSQNKTFFSGTGKAEKITMIEAFKKYWDGDKLLPDLKHGKVDDLVDAFSLMVNGYHKYLFECSSEHEI